MSKLPADCLNEIFEHLEKDEITLRSCLLVNRLWCELSVRILWRRIRYYSTLINSLPDESKEILYKNGIITSFSIPKRSPMFDYASFCKVLSVNQVNVSIDQLFKNRQCISSQVLLDILTREIFKLLMNQILSLRKLKFYSWELNIPNFIKLPGAKSCLSNLSELYCDSKIPSEFFYQLSQICHNIQLLNITFVNFISNGLADLISIQQNLKCLIMVQKDGCCLTEDIITSLTNLPNTLIKLSLFGEGCQISQISLSFIARFTHLQEIILSFEYQSGFEDFKELQDVTFPHLQILKFKYDYPSDELSKLLIKFLENNGKDLKEYDVNFSSNLLNLAIAKYCTNLRKLCVLINHNCELETLKKIFNSCQYLETVKILCCEDSENEKDIIEIVAKYSPKNLHKLKLSYTYFVQSKLIPEDLESFFVSWANRIPQKSLSLIILRDKPHTFKTDDENMKIIRKYVKLGIIKKFRIKSHDL